jgi:hypothetical protein
LKKSKQKLQNLAAPVLEDSSKKGLNSKYPQYQHQPVTHSDLGEPEVVNPLAFPLQPFYDLLFNCY